MPIYMYIWGMFLGIYIHTYIQIYMYTLGKGVVV